MQYWRRYRQNTSIVAILPSSNQQIQLYFGLSLYEKNEEKWGGVLLSELETDKEYSNSDFAFYMVMALIIN